MGDRDDFPDGSGRVTRAVLVRLDRHDLGEKDLASVGPATDEKIRPAVAIAFTRAGGKKIAGLSREHLPERNGEFAFRLGIILDGRLLSAPKILGEVGGDSETVGVESSSWGRTPVPRTRSAPSRSSAPVTKLKCGPTRIGHSSRTATPA